MWRVPDGRSHSHDANGLLLPEVLPGAQRRQSEAGEGVIAEKEMASHGKCSFETVTAAHAREPRKRLFPVAENSRKLPKLRREYPGFALAYEVIRPLLRGVLPGVLGGEGTVKHGRSSESLAPITPRSRLIATGAARGEHSRPTGGILGGLRRPWMGKFG
jgi:hypothetical protein